MVKSPVFYQKKRLIRDCRDYPLELAFFYQGVRFCELKSAAALKNLTFVK